MKGSMVTVLCAWSAEMSWNIWLGVSGVPFYCVRKERAKEISAANRRDLGLRTSS
jgi:hypothetical protein